MCICSISCGLSHSGPQYKCPSIHQAVVVPPDANFAVSYKAADKRKLCKAYKMEAFGDGSGSQRCTNGLNHWADSVRNYMGVSGSNTGVFCYQNNSCKLPGSLSEN